MRQAFRKYPECGIFAHGFARARYGHCKNDYFAAFFCKDRGVCTACNTRRMDETAALHIGAVTFIQCFSSGLNRHVHFHVCVDDGVFEELAGSVISHPAMALPRHQTLMLISVSIGE